MDVRGKTVVLTGTFQEKREAPPKGDGARYFRAHAVALDELLNTGD